MKQYEKPELFIRSLNEEVITSSKEMSSYDDHGSWGNGWSNATGGNG